MAHKYSDVNALHRCSHTYQCTADVHTQVEGDLALITPAGADVQVCEDSAHTLQGAVAKPLFVTGIP